MQRVGIATIGQAPRDDVVPELRAYLRGVIRARRVERKTDSARYECHH